MTDTWQPGTTYDPGDTVIPVVPQITVAPAPANPDFNTGLDGWSARPGWSANNSLGFGGGGCALLNTHAGTDIPIVNTNQVPVTVGQSITASCKVHQGASSAGEATASVSIYWFDSSHNQLSRSDGNVVSSSNGGSWQLSTVTAAAPSSSAFAAVGANGKNTGGRDSLRVDAFSWDYAYGAGSEPLVFTATQAAPGKSGATEPAWPVTVGATVVDNEVTWTGGAMTSVTWTASPLMESDTTEPTWPTVVGSTVVDNGVTWVCQTPRITDPNCPQSKCVSIASSKVYAGDKDVVRFSATSDPTDWTSQADAGFLPFGLQTYGTSEIQAMGLYRSCLVIFNNDGFQMWQVDEDPANAALLDAIPVGSGHQRALSPVSNDLFFLSLLGVRSMGISGGSGNLESGDVGVPIDPLMQIAMDRAANASMEPIATYYPAAGQYWIAFPNIDLTGVDVT